jgi:muconolactone D-isomerase
MVRLETNLPPEMNPARRSDLLAAELERGAQLLADGTIRDIWRIPGKVANFSVWQTVDATALHAALTSLPLFPFMQVEVTALAVHPLRAAQHGQS